GQTIDNGSLRLLDTLGCGGFGAVFRAIAPKGRGPSNTRVFAVKVIAKKSDPRAAQEQMRELAYHKRVSSHPNVVTLHRHFSDSTFIYVVLDVVLGGDLFTAIVDKATYYCNEGLTKKIFVQILDAVAWCHSRGVFHRDLKPENVLLSSNGLHAYLTDFGLATENKISKTFGVGSRAYMSPQVINEDLDCDSYSTPHNDIWALGCVLLNMLAGCGLWKRAVYADRTFMLYRQDRNLLHEALPITKSAGRILRRVFTMDPAKRISLAHLRVAVIEVDRLYLTADELNLATEEVQ
ncbi:kinase-like protein, partial [Peniophora sp. CONT]